MGLVEIAGWKVGDAYEHFVLVFRRWASFPGGCIILKGNKMAAVLRCCYSFSPTTTSMQELNRLCHKYNSRKRVRMLVLGYCDPFLSPTQHQRTRVIIVVHQLFSVVAGPFHSQDCVVLEGMEKTA